ncbi:MAG: glucokinase [Phylliscum demangeonii]|nr:MAG: glucokinase [Phylliscum demangeonii]
MALVEKAKQVAALFNFSGDDIRRAVDEFRRELDAGLKADGASSLSQIPTYVTSVPNGSEKGLFLAVDLGGTNFRVCSVQLHGNSTFTLTQSKVAVPAALQVAATAQELFRFLAKQIEIFLATHHVDRFAAHVKRRRTMSTQEGYRDVNVFRLGFTFSFPVQQQSINRGTLIRWTKGFDIDDALGRDVCALLQTEIDALHLPVRVAALVNDTVGTLMARSYTSPGASGALLGGIFGTGTNGAYVEKVANIGKLAGSAAAAGSASGDMVVNTEWGSFDNALRVLPNTGYDADLDRESVNPGIQMFEKRVSGMFLGEILRRAMLGLMADARAQLFQDQDSSSNDMRSTTSVAADSALYRRWGIDTSFLSLVQADASDGLKATRQTLERELAVSAPSLEDAQAVKELVAAIGRRSARLSAVAIGACVLKSGRLRSAESPPHVPGSAEIGQAVRARDLLGAAHATAATLQAAAAPLLADARAAIASAIHPPSTGSTATAPAAPATPLPTVDIGVDGSLVEFYPGFEQLIREALREIPGIGPDGEPRITIGIAKDGSGVGAALIALVAGQAGPPLEEEGFLAPVAEDAPVAVGK